MTTEFIKWLLKFCVEFKPSGKILKSLKFKSTKIHEKIDVPSYFSFHENTFIEIETKLA